MLGLAYDAEATSSDFFQLFEVSGIAWRFVYVFYASVAAARHDSASASFRFFW